LGRLRDLFERPGAGGVIAHLDSGRTLVDMSTVPVALVYPEPGGRGLDSRGSRPVGEQLHVDLDLGEGVLSRAKTGEPSACKRPAVCR
jgi:hypothetical protein